MIPAKFQNGGGGGIDCPALVVLKVVLDHRSRAHPRPRPWAYRPARCRTLLDVRRLRPFLARGTARTDVSTHASSLSMRVVRILTRAWWTHEGHPQLFVGAGVVEGSADFAFPWS
jgi:hypothetical protein